ncbi:Rossmann-fold NAD(P)-binding domain-containing protein [Methylomarinum vadi]|uniref:hypothetical protein n=1 Tax=Methylomarinum vadi TaxID=438855 RepID=UPI0004DF68CE|nr:hypothetical protein [Methylomarinum vadi]
MSIKTLILGGGYVGRRLADRLDAAMTHRSEEKAMRQSIYFDLSAPDSWDSLPQAGNVIWTFPAAPLDQVQAFYRTKLTNVRKLFVYASTSCYRTQQTDLRIDEDQPLDLTRERVVSEEWLRQQGATILVLAGIYGPNRQPQDWLRKGLIKTPDKRVNLIHVDDIVTITERLLDDDRNPRGERFNLADGEALLWRDIADHYGLPLQDFGNSYASKKVSNDKIRDWLGGYRFRALF